MRSRKFVEAKMAVKELLNRVRLYQHTDEHLRVEFRQLREKFNLPEYRWAYLQAYIDAIRDSWLGAVSQGGCIISFMNFGEKVVPNDWGMLTDEQREIVKADSGKDSPRFRMTFYWLNPDRTPGGVFF